jgi:uncharacterized protein YegP (UPF0339 family)
VKIEIFSRRRLVRGPLWYFRIVARNGEIVAQSEAYSRHIDARATANSLKSGIPTAEIVDA